jgi:hypothetical protein
MADEKQPWWKNGLLVALIGAAIPAATFVQGWMQKDRELALQLQQQTQQFRTQYMGVLADAGIEGMEVLADFIADTEQDPAIREWAVKQRDKARVKIADLEKRAEEERRNAENAKAAADAAAQKAKRLAARAEKITVQPSEAPGKREAAEREADDARKELARAQATAAASEVKLTRMRTALTGRGPLLDNYANTANVANRMQQQPLPAHLLER